MVELLKGGPKVINIGIRLFYKALRDQGVEVVQVSWRPPAGGDLEALRILEQLLGMGKATEETGKSSLTDP